MIYKIVESFWPTSTYQEQNAILYCSNEAYFFPTLISIFSLCSYNKQASFDIHYVLQWSYSQNSMKYVQVLSELFSRKIVVHTPKHYDRRAWWPKTRFNISTYLRLDMIELLEDKYRRIVYIDWDTRCNTWIDELFTSPMKWPVGWVADHIAHQMIWSKYYRSLLSRNLDTYWNINAWVLQVDVQASIKEWFFQKCRALFESWKHELLLRADQDLINFIARDLGFDILIDPKFNVHLFISKFSSKWGFPYTPEQISNANTYPVIKHYTGPKPWGKYAMDSNYVTLVEEAIQLAWIPMDISLNQRYHDNTLRMRILIALYNILGPQSFWELYSWLKVGIDKYNVSVKL